MSTLIYTSIRIIFECCKATDESNSYRMYFLSIISIWSIRLTFCCFNYHALLNSSNLYSYSRLFPEEYFYVISFWLLLLIFCFMVWWILFVLVMGSLCLFCLNDQKRGIVSKEVCHQSFLLKYCNYDIQYILLSFIMTLGCLSFDKIIQEVIFM